MCNYFPEGNEIRKEIRNIDELTSYLEELKKNASQTNLSIIKAQLSVIKYGGNPKVLVSSFDNFFNDLQNSVVTTSNRDEYDTIREITQILIHNFITFTNAKLEFSLSKNKFLGQDLLKNANHQLILSCINIIKLCELGDEKKVVCLEDFFDFRYKSINNTPIVSTKYINVHLNTIADDFTKNTTIKGGKWDRSVDDDPSTFTFKNEQENFIFIIKTVIEKLNKYHYTIGKSNHISLVINNYSKKIIQIKKSLVDNKIKKREQILKPILVTLSIFFTLYLLFGKYIYDSIIKSLDIFTNYQMKDNLNVFIYNWAIFGVIFLFFYSFLLLPKINLIFKIKKTKKEYEMLSENFLELQ